MIGAGLVAKKAVEKGLTIPWYVKTSLSPGSRVVLDYLSDSGLMTYFEDLGFNNTGVRLHDLHRQQRSPGSLH